LISDLFVKNIVRSNMKVGETIPLIENVFHITYVQNTGAAFSIMSGKQLLLIIMTTVMLLIVLGYIILKRPKNKLLMSSLVLILAGGVGNLIDRIHLGYVVDFFDFRLINFAIFNTADTFVVCGTILLAVYLMFFDKQN